MGAVQPFLHDGASLGARTGAALALLRALSGPHGIHASQAAVANYRAVFTRDAVMAGAAGLLAGDAAVVAGLVRTLERLRDLQGPEGQIASNFEVGDAAADLKVSYGAVVPRLDAPTWYLVGVALAARAGAVDPARFADSARRAVRLLDALEYNGRHLVYTPAGGNWADEYLTEGYTLYDQALRAWGLALLGGVYGEPAWAAKAAAVGRASRRRSGPTGATPAATRSPRSPRSARATGSTSPAARSSPSRARRPCRVRRRSTGRARASCAAASCRRPSTPWSTRATPTGRRSAATTCSPSATARTSTTTAACGRCGSAGWASPSPAAGRADDLARLRATLAAKLDAAPGYAFEEYLHGVTYAPGGTPHMAYSATGLVFLDAAARACGGDADVLRLLRP
jgi:hypothetical protein